MFDCGFRDESTTVTQHLRNFSGAAGSSGDKLNKIMPSKKRLILFVADEDLLRRIEDFRYDNRVPSRSIAVRRLIEEGLKKYEKPSKSSKKKTIPL